MKVRPPKDWSQNELKRLEAEAKMKASAEEIAKSLGRPTASVRRMARSLGLVLYKKRRKAPIAAVAAPDGDSPGLTLSLISPLITGLSAVRRP